MKYQIHKVRRLLTKAASKHIKKDEAEYFAQLEIENHIKKYPQVNGLKNAINDVKSWNSSSNRDINILVDKPSCLFMDFNRLAPSLKIKFIHDELEAKAKFSGIAIAGIKNSGGFHELSLWTDELSNRGLLSICSFNGGSFAVVPYKGNKGLFGTNPLSYSFPTVSDNVRADFSTSEIPYFELIEAVKDKQPLVNNSAVNSRGELTTDPTEAIFEDGSCNLLPIGGSVKGYLINYLLEVMTSSLFDAPMFNEKSDNDEVFERAGYILTIDISSFTNLDKFKQNIYSANVEIKKQPSFIPGERGQNKLKHANQQGIIEVEESLYVRLVKLAN